MRKRYKINLDDNRIRDEISKYDLKKDSEKFPSVFDSIIAKLSDDNFTVFDAQKIMDDHFTKKKYDIFISHSHTDVSYVKKLAGYYEFLGKTVFIDSEYWDFSEKLLQELDDRFSVQKDSSSTYSYEKRNITTTIIHNLLAVSLEKMINECEYFIFVYSNNTSGANLHRLLDSASSSDAHTISPWIYKEIITADIIYINKFEDVSKSLGGKRKITDESPLFFYDIEQLISGYYELDINNMEPN
ncbi:hypothetical protein WKV52_06685 [Tetragenococcus halophilus]|uniref:hypothetical protein n=1 Tax=Tetragenococcus halophilus TaxID=51669 RepID=UPI0030C9DD3E